MISAPIPANEAERLANLYKYKILDTLKESGFNEIIKIAAYCCGAEASYITFIDKDRQWNKAQIGFEGQEAPRDISFCAHTILKDEILEVFDAALDARFNDNPFVTGDLKLRFYTGVPITSKEGFNIGSLCVFDKNPKQLSDDQKDVLKLLANRVVSELELRLELIEAKDRKAELQKMVKFKDHILSIVSHDLRAPLNSIRGTIDMFEKGYLKEDDLKQLMGYLKLEANTTTQLLDNLLNWAKTKLDNFELQRTEFNVNHVIEETIQLYKPEANRKNIGLEFKMKEDNVQVCGEAEMIKLAIRNLINNSIKFCRDGDRIEVSTETKSNKSIVWIKDTGVGMTGEKLSKILGENSLGSEEGTANEKGIGLGLILINEFIKTNHGKIMATSMPNEGTTFRIELPSNC